MPAVCVAVDVRFRTAPAEVNVPPAQFCTAVSEILRILKLSASVPLVDVFVLEYDIFSASYILPVVAAKFSDVVQSICFQNPLLLALGLMVETKELNPKTQVCDITSP